MKIGYRTVKTAVGMALSVVIAQWLGLEYYTSAAILTILCIQTTRKRSYQTAWERFLACLLGMFLSAVFFQSLGYFPWSLSLILLLLIPMCVYVGAKDGIVTSTVIILHFYMAKQVTIQLVFNELALLVIGIGMAMLVNLHMPNMEKELKQYREKIEDNFRKILREFAAYLRNGESDWDGKEITETTELLKKAKDLALRAIENHAHDEYNFYRYFEMRERQFDILVRIAPQVSSMKLCCEQGRDVADFLEQLADAIHPGNTASIYLEKLDQVREKFKSSPLPTSQEEFETRAALHHFINEMRRYLLIKKDLRQKTTKPVKNGKNAWLLFLKRWNRKKLAKE